MPANSFAITSDLIKVALLQHAAIGHVGSAMAKIMRAVTALKQGNDVEYGAGLDAALDELSQVIDVLNRGTEEFGRITRELGTTSATLPTIGVLRAYTGSKVTPSALRAGLNSGAVVPTLRT
jgi:hypothetical protein